MVGICWDIGTAIFSEGMELSVQWTHRHECVPIRLPMSEFIGVNIGYAVQGGGPVDTSRSEWFMTILLEIYEIQNT